MDEGPKVIQQAEPPPETRRYSEPMLITGTVLTGLGTVLGLTGLTVYLISTADCSEPETGESESCLGSNAETSAAVMAISGGVMLAVGVPLILIGAKRVPVNVANNHATPPRVEVPRNRAELLLGPQGLTVRGTF